MSSNILGNRWNVILVTTKRSISKVDVWGFGLFIFIVYVTKFDILFLDAFIFIVLVFGLFIFIAYFIV